MNAGDTPEPPDHSELPLRERFPEYLVVFGVGLAAAAVAGAVVGTFSSVSFASAVGYAVLMLGIVFLLAGGASGGGYTNMGLGAVERLLGGRGREEDVDDADTRRGGRPRVDPEERLRRGLRPEANPRAFWQVVGGFAYVGIGIVVVQVLG